MHSLAQHPFGSSEAFKTYTTDIIKYMLYGAKYYFVYANARSRILSIRVLEDLKSEFASLLWKVNE
jgi:hypothetical protein